MTTSTRDKVETSRVSAATVRVRTTEGDLVRARAALETLRGQTAETAEVLLVEARLLEAEQRPEEAIICLQRALKTAPATLLTNTQMARLATALEREQEAGEAGLATLAMEADNLDGLLALAFAHQRAGRKEALWDILRRIALSPDISEARLWQALKDLAAAERWADVIEIVDRREYELTPWLVVPLRVRGLIELGWRRRALQVLMAAFADDYILAGAAVDLLIQARALNLAAMFVSEALRDDPWRPRATATVAAEASRVCAEAPLEIAPFVFADAIRAREILARDDAAITRAVTRARTYLMTRASEHMARGDSSLATDVLIHAVRLAPQDMAALDALATAARDSGRTDRFIDTLTRIWQATGEPSALLDAAVGALQTARWPKVVELIAEARAGSSLGHDDLARIVKAFGERAFDRLEEHLGQGEPAAGLELVVGLTGLIAIADWPAGQIAWLLRAARRWLYGQRAVDAAICFLYLRISPGDVDVSRMLARVLVRQRRFAEARDLQTQVIESNPHSPQDWIALAVAHHELGEFDKRDFCTARSLVIAPDIALPSPLRPFLSRMSAR